MVFNIGAGGGQADEARATLQAGRVLHLLEVHEPQQIEAIERRAVGQAK